MLKILEDLVALARERKSNPVEGSYTNKLLEDQTLAKEKVLEEINELIEAVEKDTNKIHEAADVLYHLIMYLEKMTLTNYGSTARYPYYFQFGSGSFTPHSSLIGLSRSNVPSGRGTPPVKRLSRIVSPRSPGAKICSTPLALGKFLICNANWSTCSQ